MNATVVTSAFDIALAVSIGFVVGFASIIVPAAIVYCIVRGGRVLMPRRQRRASSGSRATW